MYTVIFLLLTVCGICLPIGVYNRENRKLQTNLQHGGIFQEIGHWFDNLKNQIYEKLIGQSTATLIPSFIPPEILNLDKLQLQERLKNQKWLLLDLNNLSFDPNHDWGFHIDNWYFIRKELKSQDVTENNFDESDFYKDESNIKFNDPVKTNTEDTFETLNDSMTTKFLPVTLTTKNEISTETQQATAQTYSTKNSSLRTHQWMEDNETSNSHVNKGSVEVLMG